MKNSFIVLFLLISQSLFAQTILKAEALQNDFEIIRKSYEQMHPGLYKYQSKKTIDAAFETCKKALNKDQTLTEAYLTIHQLTSSFKCGHAYPNFFNQENFLKKEVFEQKNALPFHFKIIDDRMIVIRSADSTIKKGIEIKSINGIKIQKIIHTILPIVRADGSNDGKRKSLLENGKEYFSYFDIFFPIFFNIKHSTFTIAYADFGSKKSQTIEVSAMNHADRDKIIKANYQETEYKKIAFNWLNAETAVMTINDFNNYNGKTDYAKFYLESLQEYNLKKGKNLIIDVRKNEGGNSSEMFKLIPYFTDKPIDYVDIQNTWQMLKIDSTLKPLVSNSDWAKYWFDQRNKGYQETSLGQWKAAKNAQVFTPNSERFTGNIFLLSSATNSSAAYMMVETFKKYKLATIVGQTTGGNQRGITAGAMFFISLPNSKIEVDVPLIGTDLALAQTLPDAGIEPDVFVQPSIADLIKGIDTEMNTVNKLINKQKQ